MTESDWNSGSNRSLAVLIDDPDSDDPTESLYLMLNATEETMRFVLPVGSWDLALSSGFSRLNANQVEAEGFTVTVMQGR